MTRELAQTLAPIDSTFHRALEGRWTRCCANAGWCLPWRTAPAAANACPGH